MKPFRCPEKVALPEGVESKSELRNLLSAARTEEIGRRLQSAIACGNHRLALWLKNRKQQILGRQVLGNVSISGSVYTNKIYIPVQEFPESNFVGLIIGPRGSTQKQLERITRARIYIRGSYKDKHVEPLHCYISAETQESLKNASAVIENLIEDSVLFGDCRLRMSQLQAIRECRRNPNGPLTDWERFYYWWYFHNRIQRKAE
ncbi:hypothetical protein [Encephalitozoon cuniculi GB-M1]|uniref:Branchpoint-bridging protein n=2 Tax=Encephalitozoon cuniculi TaxID=6035 RepID=Q8SWB0_ENCCU|nr:mRNA splicing protein MSL5 [Encephalitozoon cuniculi GB-M1]AGE95596.1 hypothetical protein ECU02_1160 [Encephalitozoon cuniculi]KMV66634.1 hypothetical protein M970_021120 [Encephalitozoon cuniculi EcunIII-L]UYI28309.1 putative protein quaking [Encephalitozoon cuniculi]CAD25145.1 hypothetical protein [Encephalitozoon cuniculi GB-M1]